MKRKLSLPTLLFLFFAFTTHAQNSSPYWSLAGNSNATTSSKLGTTNSIPLNLVTNNVTRFKIFATGQAGFGANITTANATRVLNLADANAVMRILRVSATNAPAIELLSRTTADGANKAYWDMYAEPSDASFRIRDRVTGDNLDRLTITKTGDVGIGTTSPGYQLHVEGGTARAAVYGKTAGTYGMYGVGKTYGMYGAGASYGVYGKSDGEGLHGEGGSYGVRGNGDYIGVYGTGVSFGVYGSSNSYGLYGSGNYGVYGSGSTYGVYGSGSAAGVYGAAYSLDKSGVHGEGSSAFGVSGNSTGNYGGYFTSTNLHGIYAKTSNSNPSAYAAVFQGNTYAYGSYLTSDERVKKNIIDVNDAMALINQLKPKAYEFISDGKYSNLNLPKGAHYGLLAQDVEKLFPALVREAPLEVQAPEKVVAQEPNSNAPDTATLRKVPIKIETVPVKAINYTELIPIMVKAMQELDADNEQLKKHNDDLEARLQRLEALLLKGNNTSSAAAASLEAPLPNPSNGSALVRYALPEGVASAKLTLVNAKGQLLKTVSLNGSGAGQVNINTSSLPSGVYTYTLWVNGQQRDSKQLVIAR